MEDNINAESVIDSHSLTVDSKPKDDPFDGRTLDDGKRKSYLGTADGSEKLTSNSETHAVAESNPHLVTLEVTANPVDVRDDEQEDSGYHVGGAETAHESEVNYGIESADDGLVEYTHAAHTTPSTLNPSRRTRARRQSDDSGSDIRIRVKTLSSYSTFSTSSTSSLQSENRDLQANGQELTTEVSSGTSSKPPTVKISKLSVKPLRIPLTNSPTHRPLTSSSSVYLQSSKSLEVSSAIPSTEAVENNESSPEPTPEHTFTSEGRFSETSNDPFTELTSEISAVAEPSLSTTVASNRNPKARKDNDLEKSDAEPEPESEFSAKFVSSGDSDGSTTYMSGPYTPKLDFHAMDCTDIVTGMAQGFYSRIQDQYTRDRSTPREDWYWGGSDSLTLASGFEQDGVTTIIFRRRLES